MRVKLATGAITEQDKNRGIGVYAQEFSQRLNSVNNPDIIHSLVFKLFSNKQIPKINGIPTVVTVHDLIPLK